MGTSSSRASNISLTLRNRTTLSLRLTELLNKLGNINQSGAIRWIIFLGAGDTWLAWLIILPFITGQILALPGGKLADRFSLPRLLLTMIGIQISMAIGLCFLPIGHRLTIIQIIILASIQLVASATETISSIASMALQQKLAEALSLQDPASLAHQKTSARATQAQRTLAMKTSSSDTIFSTLEIGLGMSLGWFFTSSGKIHLAFFFNIFTFIPYLWRLVFLLRNTSLQPGGKPDEPQREGHSHTGIFAYTRRRHSLMLLLGLVFAANLGAIGLFMLPIIATTVLHDGLAYPCLIGVNSLGTLIAASTMATARKKPPTWRGIFFWSATYSVCTIVFGASHILWLSAASLGLLCYAMVTFSECTYALIVTSVDSGWLGRAIGLKRAFTLAGIITGTLLAMFLVPRIGGSAAFMVIGGMCLVGTLLGLGIYLRFPQVRQISATSARAAGSPDEEEHHLAAQGSTFTRVAGWAKRLYGASALVLLLHQQPRRRRG